MKNRIKKIKKLFFSPIFLLTISTLFCIVFFADIFSDLKVKEQFFTLQYILLAECALLFVVTQLKRLIVRLESENDKKGK